MKDVGQKLQPIWLDKNLKVVKVIDQRRLPHEFVIVELKTVDDIIMAIKEMLVRGAPLIGVTGAFGVYLAVLKLKEGKISENDLIAACDQIKSTRPTAVNLAWGVNQVIAELSKENNITTMPERARKAAEKIAEAEAKNCLKIGEHGLCLIKTISEQKNRKTVNILTHCNAGWLACGRYGTATAPMYAAVDNGIDIHVWVDETRPLNQGARLTAWELGKCGVKHTVITDNAGGHLMQHGMVDMVIVGSDRTTCSGDAANKIGTYLKALAARDNNVPFYVALPSSTFDWDLRDGVLEIPIENRDADEIRYVQGKDEGIIRKVLIPPADSPVANFAFDVTPAKFITGFITERGVCAATEHDIKKLFPEKQTDCTENLEKKILL
ncbi:MAG: S-methyl-5-thioribose-1-phosphate isomerase [Nitrospinales bacterium]